MTPVSLDLSAPLGQCPIQDTKIKKKKYIRFVNYKDLETIWLLLRLHMRSDYEKKVQLSWYTMILNAFCFEDRSGQN